MAPDLSRLNAAERRILALLAQGHTAKSIAAETGLSVAAVNERLREARRKSGVGSSRELARLTSRKNRDEEIGVAPPAAPPAGRTGNPARLTGWIIMATFVAAAAIGIVLFTLAPEPVPQGAPRVVATFPAQGASVPPGRVVVRVTFDRPMRAGSYSFVQLDRGSYPDCARTPRQSADHRSFELDCTAASGRSYAIGFNSARFRNFVSTDGVPGEPAVLRFTTR